MNIVKKTVWTAAVVFLSLVMVGKASPAAAADGATIDVGYQYLHASSGGASESVPAGFTAGVTVPLQGVWGVVGDFGWNRKSEDGGHFTLTSYGAGLRFTPATMSQFMPYVQAVIGAESDKFSGGGFSSTDTNLMIQPGVGGSFGAGSLRGFGEVDYRFVSTSGDSTNEFLFRAGILIPIGHK